MLQREGKLHESALPFLDLPSTTSTPHNDKSIMPLWCASVTQPLDYKDPRRYSAQAQAAVEAELAALRARPTWDEANPLPKARAKELHPDAHFATIFELVVRTRRAPMRTTTCTKVESCSAGTPFAPRRAIGPFLARVERCQAP